jgi:hypothetical protein
LEQRENLERDPFVGSADPVRIMHATADALSDYQILSRHNFEDNTEARRRGLEWEADRLKLNSLSDDRRLFLSGVRSEDMASLLRELVSQVASARLAWQQAGQARLAAYRMRGQDPNGRVLVPGESNVQVVTKVVADAFRKPFSSYEGWTWPSGEKELSESYEWSVQRLNVASQAGRLFRHVLTLDKRERAARALLQAWADLAVDRWYYHYGTPVPGLVHLELKAWEFVNRLPELKNPRSIASVVADEHAKWTLIDFRARETDVKTLSLIASTF